MPESSRRPFWAGRTLALAAILLLALNLRTAVAALSPIVGFISDDVPLNPLALGVLGMLPPVAFAVCGPIAPGLTRRLGLEALLAGACLAMLAGAVLRASADSPPVLLAGTAVIFLGMGMGNVLLPPAVKRYFPDRVGIVTAGYATVMAISASTPPAVAVPIAGAFGWRPYLAVWGLIAIPALIPWVLLGLRARTDARARGQSRIGTPATEW